MPRRGFHRRAARDWLLPARRSFQRRRFDHAGVFNELPDSPFSRARRRLSRFSPGRRVDAERHVRRDRPLSSLCAGDKSRRLRLSLPCSPAYSCRQMNPLANEWEIQHRSDVCSQTQRQFADGEYFYTLLFRDAGGFRREDLSEEAWMSRNDNIRPFSFWKSRYEPAP